MLRRVASPGANADRRVGLGQTGRAATRPLTRKVAALNRLSLRSSNGRTPALTSGEIQVRILAGEPRGGAKLLEQQGPGSITRGRARAMTANRNIAQSARPSKCTGFGHEYSSPRKAN